MSIRGYDMLCFHSNSFIYIVLFRVILVGTTFFADIFSCKTCFSWELNSEVFGRHRKLTDRTEDLDFIVVLFWGTSRSFRLLAALKLLGQGATKCLKHINISMQ